MHIAILPILIPLISGFITLFAKPFGLKVQRALAVASLLVILLFALLGLVYVLEYNYITYQLGNWDAPFGISLVLDRLSALMVLVTTILAIGAIWYAINNNIDKEGEHFHVLFLLQIFGINGAFLTGDLFNLFVFFEILLLASYSLLLHGQGKDRTKAGLHYVVINLVGSTLFLFAVGILYGVLGTLNIADLAYKISQLSSNDTTIVAVAGLLLLLVFGLKAAMFPLYLWLPAAYSKTSAPVAALFAIMTKVGIYAIIRVHGTLFGSKAGELSHYYTPWLLNIGLITLIMATFGVMSAQNFKLQVSYLVLASVSLLLTSVGINTVESLSGTIYYIIHSTLLAGGMFLVADVISRSRGKFGDSLVRAPTFKNAIFVGSIYFIFAIALAGIPPLSGFFGKMMILYGALGHIQQGLIYTIILLSSLLIIISLVKTGSTIFYDTDTQSDALPSATTQSTFYPIIFLMSFAFLMVIFANPLSEFNVATSMQLFDSQSYIDAILGMKEGDI